MKIDMMYFVIYYCKTVTEMIVDKYDINFTKAYESFINSETFQMIIDEELEMWEFSPIGIFDMWRVEQETGNPCNSIYLSAE
ncbi:MAG: hypothetical protein LUG12_06290 [Erysipelotrichaceae bacterium]|nr:hypothetical protein [Erysipelotrichaceae bacterium]